MDPSLISAVRTRAANRCEYCQMPQVAHVLTFPVDHIIARQHNGSTTLGNLALSCVRCNSFKGPNIAGIDPVTQEICRLFHPRTDNWRTHFQFDSIEIIGLTPIGRTSVKLLQMNHPDYLTLRASLMTEGLAFG